MCRFLSSLLFLLRLFVHFSILPTEFGYCLSLKVMYTIDLFCLTNTIFHFHIERTKRTECVALCQHHVCSMHSKIQEFIFENSVVTCRSRLCTACTHQKSTSSLQIFIFSVFWHFGISHRYLYYNFIFRNVQQKQIQIHLAMCVMYTRHDLLGITTNTNAMRHYLSQRAMNTTTTTSMRNGIVAEGLKEGAAQIII